ncbi:MAG: hypothetical protein M3P37_04145 [Actinomycetota bacterium]|nr:hypothetical protein [Actinomycetota bacterium]
MDRVRVEAAALAQAVDGADTLTDEEPQKRAEALARTLEEGKAGAKNGPLAEARTEAENMAGSLTEIEEQAGEPAPDRARAIAEAREKAEALAGALDRAGDNAKGDTRPKDLDEASADVRTVASDLTRAEKEIADQETENQKTEGQEAGGKPAEGERAEGQDKEQGFFVRVREFFASTFG